jgi:tetratricopeptide (TPR) repeat protein
MSVTDLFTQYLQKQITAHAAGLGHAEPRGDALPFEAVPVQPVDPALAWKDALTCTRLLANNRAVEVPPEWPALVARQEPAIALAFALGNFPQLVRNLHPLLSGQPIALRDGPREVAPSPALLEWANLAGDQQRRLLAAGVLRLARHFDAADKLLDFAPESDLATLHGNERAALAWHRGDAEKALAIWKSLPDSAVTQFNRGMAQLFLGETADAVVSLGAAVAGLPETSAWHHLAQLYLALAQAR